jgi:hypothetical protein
MLQGCVLRALRQRFDVHPEAEIAFVLDAEQELKVDGLVGRERLRQRNVVGRERRVIAAPAGCKGGSSSDALTASKRLASV